MDNSEYYDINEERRSRISFLAEKYSLLIRYTALAVIGVATGLIVNAISQYSYPEWLISAVRCSPLSPFEGTSSAYEAMGALLEFAHPEIIFVFILYIAGMTFIARPVLSAAVLIRGLLLGISTGYLAAGAAGTNSTVSVSHPVISALINAVTLAFLCVVFTVSAAFTDNASGILRSSPKSGMSMIASKQFLSYQFSALTLLGAVILIRLIHSALLYFLNII